MFAPKIAKPQTKAAASSTNSLARQLSTLVAQQPGHGAVEQAHMLQRASGDQATLRLLAQGAVAIERRQKMRDDEGQVI